LLPPTEVQEH